ncbi:uncharacterized protein LOC111059368 isoform X2 [Nilaparvata lugens]|uniref:uncharacterized protein LOC111059368 isoform X2 n=1 Tax=Nilaparvata lugens TaxID=108931 RepID=UPI00193DBE7D|nr:uncharacterized protein LOC111059368 isoform X2 [Nilaparvata lugens]
MQLYKANKPLIHNGFSLHNGSVLESADVEEVCAADQTDSKTANCSEIKSKNPVFDLNEAKNNELIVPQVDSGEGSLEIQQDSEYTEAYDSAAQLSCPVSKKVDNQTRQPDSLIVESNCNNSNEERRIESEDTTPKSTESNGIDSENHESESETFDMFSAPPRPGTIAEREHKKWLQAVPLTNNPYSKENIERRQRERMLLGRQTSNETSVEFPELTGENNASVVPIDCSGCKPNHKQYGRDYYINNTSDQKERRDSSNDARTDISTTHAYDASKSQVSVRVEVEVGGRWNGGGTAPAVAKSAVETRTHVSNLNNQQLLTTVSTSKSRDRQQVTTVSTWGAAADHDDDYDDDPIALPSVKELAKQFSNVETDPQPQIQAAEVQASSTPALKNKLEVQTLPVRQVHSLTARCISKEFREGLRASNRPADHMKPVEKAESCGNISDDSGTASPTPTSNQKLCNSIAFWEQINSTR